MLYFFSARSRRTSDISDERPPVLSHTKWPLRGKEDGDQSVVQAGCTHPTLAARHARHSPSTWSLFLSRNKPVCCNRATRTTRTRAHQGNRPEKHRRKLRAAKGEETNAASLAGQQPMNTRIETSSDKLSRVSANLSLSANDGKSRTAEKPRTYLWTRRARYEVICFGAPVALGKSLAFVRGVYHRY